MDEQKRMKMSQKRFGHPNASWDDIRRYESQKRFGHPDASVEDILRHQQRQRAKDQSSLARSTTGQLGLKIGGSLVLEFGTGNIGVRQS